MIKRIYLKKIRINLISLIFLNFILTIHYFIIYLQLSLFLTMLEQAANLFSTNNDESLRAFSYLSIVI